MQDVLGKGLQLVGSVDQPLQPRMRVHCDLQGLMRLYKQ
jgi:hypothetical protein